jgi:CHAD domain-containing protein
MAKQQNRYLWHCENFELPSLIQVLAPDYQLEAGKLRTTKASLYDSFGRSFASAGLALMRVGNRFTLVDGDDLHSAPLTSDQLIKHRRPVFHWDFDSSDFQRVLRSHLKLRAATQIASVELEEREVCIRNGDEKIVLRLKLHSTLANGGIVGQRLTTAHLLGYEKEADEIAKRISQLSGLSQESSPLLHSILNQSGEGSVPKSAKEIIEIDPDSSVQEAVTKIARFMIRVARQTEPGIIDDIDTEYLHDYRVSIRKLRSVITLVKGAYSEEETRRLKDGFGDLARETNRLRDLDVYLLDEEDYRQHVPESIRSGLDRMFADLRAERATELGRLRRRLQSAEYKREMDSLVDWFSQSELSCGERAELAIGDVVEKEVRKHYRHVRKLGMALTRKTPDEEVHELRIECKKLRYLLEIFASLFHQKQLKNILKRLKGLQNILGDFNDYSVQSESMLEYLNNAKRLDKHSASAIGGLIAILHSKQLEARTHVKEHFKEFADGKMRNRFKKLFAGIHSSKP